jgi:hypothetical protein
MRTAWIEGNIPLKLRSNYFGLPLDYGVNRRGEILEGGIATASRPIAVQGFYGEAGKLKDRLAKRFCWGLCRYGRTRLPSWSCGQ